MSHPTVFPSLHYDDALGAIEWLERALGAERHALYADGAVVHHAELRFGNGIVMLGSAREGVPATRGRGGGIYVAVGDPDALFGQARDAGADVLRELQDTDYGSREFGVRDLEGNAWHFGTYQPFDHGGGNG
jgi:uncharacterized glyoxalase superfamily protein PhnB